MSILRTRRETYVLIVSLGRRQALADCRHNQAVAFILLRRELADAVVVGSDWDGIPTSSNLGGIVLDNLVRSRDLNELQGPGNRGFAACWDALQRHALIMYSPERKNRSLRASSVFRKRRKR